MPKTINSDTTEPWLIDESSAIWTLEDTGSISTNGVAILEDSAETQNRLRLRGGIHSGDQQGGSVGVELDGRRTHVHLGKGALIDTETGVHLVGRNDSVVNYGTIDVTGTGIIADDAQLDEKYRKAPSIWNFGTISGAIGMQVNNANLWNYDVISGTDVGLSAAGAKGSEAAIRNYGTISGNVAVDGGDGSFTLLNDGHINGSVLMGAGDDAITFEHGSNVTGVVDGGSGDDLFQFDGGRYDHPIAGGSGDDVYRLGSPKDAIVEDNDGGTDAIAVGFSYTLPENFEWLYINAGNKHHTFGTGNDADNLLYGGYGKVVLNGGSGNDVLLSLQGNGSDKMIGGAGDDTFAFTDYQSIIEDFTEGEDKLAFADTANITSYADVRIEQHGDDTWVGYTHHNSFRVHAVLRGVDASALTASDFIFHFHVERDWSWG
jgi:Ca2+-binding RTX toxin-like protein